MSNTKVIGNKIAEARKRINISQAELAQRLFISSQAVGKWERGESMPDITTFNRLAEILGVDLNYFSENFTSTVQATGFKTSNDLKENPEKIEQGHERQLLTDFSGSNLQDGNFEGVTAHNRNFSGSALRGSNFQNADLTGSSFKGSDVSDANFNRANLTDCIIYTCNLKDASFDSTILVGTKFTASDMAFAKFVGANLINVKLAQTDLRKTIFENCSFNGVDFKQADLSDVSFDGQTFTGVKFDRAALNKTTFKGATLRNVSFRPGFALTNKYYRAIKTINFEGATMDKLTYASLKGIGAHLSNVTII